MSLLQSVKSRRSTTQPKDESTVSTADEKEVDAIAGLEQQLQAELRTAITALLQARSPTQQADIYRQVAAELNAASIAHDSFQRALGAIYPDNQPDATIITENLAAHGYARPERTAPSASLTAPPGAMQSQSYAAAAPSAPISDGQGTYPQSQRNGQRNEQRVSVPKAVATKEPTILATTTTLDGKLDYYNGFLLSETIASGAFSTVILGAPKTGASTVLRAFIWSMLYEPISQRPTINVIETRCNYWQGLEQISGLIAPIPVVDRAAIDQIALRIEKAHKELTDRQHDYRSKGKYASLYEWKPYLLAVDGWGEVMDYLAKYSTKQLEEDAVLKPMFIHLRRLLSLGPDVGMTTILTARSYDRVLPDNRSLGETRLIVLGRPTPDFGGGFEAIERLINDKHQLPGHSDRARMATLLTHAKRVGQPVIMAVSGGVRMAKMPDLSEHNQHDFAQAYRDFDTF